MSRRQIAVDLERKFITDLEGLYDRHAAIMSHVLEPWEMCLILIHVVTGSILTTAATVVGQANAGADPATLYDEIIANIQDKVARSREGALARAVEHLSQQREAQA